ncbi:NADPH-dependent FMN reductase [Halapricum hydrolyticum]|uniref:NAD(P)H-dependent oxidoreductase n=1 Tax=Halapricum hydrolyticum TaxID=2979991 RepID=A0AAE3ICP7_9EURY|nr:NAD(P)H-dependent oxidoreductase [Halapricum hydrolyticum]MCU4719124.1 NAD(P)H-dependent oxidoreductase [Halapricum hydrolyticum]MCU4727314.1 NAD(P)H-dependent oxidoreductase [Halapricum hydrolyticum]
MAEPHVIAIAGSLRENSYTRVAVERALQEADTAGASTDLIDLRELDLPVFDADAREAGDAPELTRRIRRADSILLGTPVYHGSYSAPLKNALDYCGFDEFEKKTVGLLAVAGGSFPITALDHLRSVCRALDCWVIPHQAAVPRASSAIEDGEFVDGDLETRVAALGEDAVQYANIEPEPASFESEENVGADD